ncbi:MAG: response regulator [Candidatus Aminicenantes bacterium]|nr:response regulator [Candidatus Aminicenantes bacterium]
MSYKVIIADGSPYGQKAAELALPAPEFEIAVFSDGLEAIEAIRDGRPDAVLTALALASKDGYDVAAFVRAGPEGRAIALFYLRGAFEPIDTRRAAETDPDGIVQKPFDGETVAMLVRETIDRKKELPSLPEEPALETAAEPPRPPESVTAAVLAAPDGTGDLEKKVRGLVREEIRNSRSELTTVAREIISAEFKKLLVEELKGIDTRKI